MRLVACLAAIATERIFIQNKNQTDKSDTLIEKHKTDRKSKLQNLQNRSTYLINPKQTYNSMINQNEVTYQKMNAGG